MLVYRIVREAFSTDINSASGYRGRWNDDGQFVLYTAESRALAYLENLVHRSNSGLNQLFKTMVIDVPDDLPRIVVDLSDLPINWRDSDCPECLVTGANWYVQNQSPVLKVPSSIVPEEWNHILNTKHPEFKRISLIRTENFLFDQRL
jgi:RES domain-containing protein